MSKMGNVKILLTPLPKAKNGAKAPLNQGKEVPSNPPKSKPGAFMPKANQGSYWLFP